MERAHERLDPRRAVAAAERDRDLRAFACFMGGSRSTGVAQIAQCGSLSAPGQPVVVLGSKGLTAVKGM